MEYLSTRLTGERPPFLPRFLPRTGIENCEWYVQQRRFLPPQKSVAEALNRTPVACKLLLLYPLTQPGRATSPLVSEK